MKHEKWLIYIIVAFTSITTVLLLTDDTLLGFARAILSAVILDGLIIYWDDKRVTLKSDKQRAISSYMMWAGVGIMLTFAGGYGVEVFAPVDASNTMQLFGYSFVLTLTDFILMLAMMMIGAWVVLTLGVILYMRGIDPEITKDLELTKALTERDAVEMNAYKTALKVTARQIGTEKAIKLFRLNLAQEGYTEVEIDKMENEARMQIMADRGESIPVNTHAYSAEVEAPSFTKASTPKN